MSVVVGLKQNGKVYIGADSQITMGSTKFTVTNPNNFKVWEVDGVPNCLMAYAGRTSFAQFLRVFPPEISRTVIYEDTLDWSYVVKNILPHIYTVLQETERIKKEETILEIELLFAYKDRLFYISGDGGVFEIDDFIAIGSGSNEAYGSLSTTIGKPAEKRIISAMESAFSVNNYVDYPIVITDTEKLKFKIINEN